MLSVLDSQCKFPRASDDTLLASLHDNVGSHSHFRASSRQPGAFTVQHYAGEVHYSVAGFLDKNKDALSADIAELLQARRGGGCLGGTALFCLLFS